MKRFGSQKEDGKLTLAYVRAQEIWFYSEKLSQFAVYQFPPELIHNLEITHVDQLYVSLNEFMQSLKLNPTELYIILSGEVYFLRDIVLEKGEKKEDFVRRFTDNLPFEIIFSKQIIFNHTEKVVGLNRYTYQPLVLALTKIGFNVSTMLPDFVLEEAMQDDAFDMEDAHNLVLSTDRRKYEKFNFLAIQDESKDTEVLTIDNSLPEKKKVIPLIIVFVLLLSVLGTLIWYTQSGRAIPFLPAYADPEPPATAQPDPTFEEITDSESSTEEAIAKPAVQNLSLAELQIAVIDTSADESQFPVVEQVLLELGVQSVTATSSAALEPEAPIILFTDMVSDADQQQLVTTVSEITGELQTEQDPELEYDVLLLLPPAVINQES